ncbi:hypothetical protein VZT92_022918 [Zoarces viviparus]
MDAYICGPCRMETLPRLIIITQWDLQGTALNLGDCVCQWNGYQLLPCWSCSLLQRSGQMMQAGVAEGWQVRKFLQPIQTLAPGSWGGGGGAKAPVETVDEESGAPSAPSLSPSDGDQPEASGRRMGGPRET